MLFLFFFSSRRRHTRYWRDWSSDVCSSDLVRRGQRIEVGPEPGTPIVADLAPVAAGRAAARVWPGPRLDWFVPDALEVLCAAPWTVGQAVSRVGMRLDGAALRRIVERELPSEGLVEGAVQ